MCENVRENELKCLCTVPNQALYQAKLHSVISYRKRLTTTTRTPTFALVTRSSDPLPSLQGEWQKGVQRGRSSVLLSRVHYGLLKVGRKQIRFSAPAWIIHADGRTLWLSYSANFAHGIKDFALKTFPPGSRHGMWLQEINCRAPKRRRSISVSMAKPVPKT
jgi:hypothetical protein